MTALPAKNVLDGSTAPLTSAMKTAMGQLRDFIAETVGAVGGALTIAKTTVTSPVAADGNVFSGTYTPTLTATTNVSASTAYATQYSRVGSVVTVSGRIAVTCTSVAAFEIGISLPVASNFSDVYQAAGVLCSARNGGIVFGNAALDRVQGQSYPVGTGSEAYFYSFTYRVI